MQVEVESGFMGEQACINIKRDAFACWSGAGTSKEIPPEQQAKMLDNFKAAMEFQGLLVVVY